MPVEIKELHIKATIVDKKTENSTATSSVSTLSEKAKKELIRECVQEVLQVLEDKMER